MKSGYDQFFKKARENAGHTTPKNAAPRRPQPKIRFDLSGTEKAAPKSPSSEQMTKDLRNRMQQKRKKPKRSKIPWKLAGVSFLGMIVAAAGVLEHERIESMMKKVEISMIGSAQAEEKAPDAKGKADAGKDGKDAKDGKDSKDAKKDEAAKADEGPKKKEFTDEELNHFAKLNERKHELDAREEELNRLEAEIQAQKNEIEKKIQTLDKTRRDISSVLEEKVKTDDKKVDTLVQTYSNMKPQQAAKVLEEMNEDLAVDIIGRMKKKNAAEIMNLLKPEKARVFAEKFAGYKRD